MADSWADLGEGPLPEGWTMKLHTVGNHVRPYFVHHASKTTQWDDPRKPKEPKITAPEVPPHRQRKETEIPIQKMTSSTISTTGHDMAASLRATIAAAARTSAAGTVTGASTVPENEAFTAATTVESTVESTVPANEAFTAATTASSTTTSATRSTAKAKQTRTHTTNTTNVPNKPKSSSRAKGANPDLRKGVNPDLSKGPNPDLLLRERVTPHGADPSLYKGPQARTVRVA